MKCSNVKILKEGVQNDETISFDEKNNNRSSWSYIRFDYNFLET
jgi:hypothetical protein